jgi:HD superfamily phosphohydrolase
MYWQVYLHKTVLCAEKMMVRIIERARALLEKGVPVSSGSRQLDFFLQQTSPASIEDHLEAFGELDDYDVLAAIKNWVHHEDPVLRYLCSGLVDRRLLKVKLQAEPIAVHWVEQLRKKLLAENKFAPEHLPYLIFSGEAINTTYNPIEERIDILFKDGSIKDISLVDHALIHQALATPMKKYYICFPEEALDSRDLS